MLWPFIASTIHSASYHIRNQGMKIIYYKIINHYCPSINPCWPSYFLVSNKPGEKYGDFKVGQCKSHCQVAENLKHSDHFLDPSMLGMIAGYLHLSDNITYSASYSGVPLSFGYQVSQQSISSEKAEADVCCLCEFLKTRGISEVFCSWTAIYQRYNNLTKK